MELKVYLSGEIHTDWRQEIVDAAKKHELPIQFLSPTTDHEASDNAGDVLGSEEKVFWKDHKSAKVNTIRNRHGLEQADIVIIKFGEKYRQWNAAFDAGYAAAFGKSYIVIHPEEFNHALKEIDAQAMAVARETKQAIEILKYLTKDYY